MGSKSQVKNPLVELIEWKMKTKNMSTQIELSKETGVGKSNISRFFNGGGLSASNVHSILNKLDLLNTPDAQSREITKCYRDLAEERKYIEQLLNENYELKSQIFFKASKKPSTRAKISRIKKDRKS